MKKIIIFLAMVFPMLQLTAQVADYRVVFDLTSKDSVNQQAVVREIGLIKNSNPDAKLEVVVYGQGLNFVLKDKSAVPQDIQRLLGMKDVSVNVCAMTLKRNNIDKQDLLPGVGVVSDGIYEIITKQHEGWGYIKVAH
jgi:intracellular sulfur oxidation DsrE/DsrF family protein